MRYNREINVERATVREFMNPLFSKESLINASNNNNIIASKMRTPTKALLANIVYFICMNKPIELTLELIGSLKRDNETPVEFIFRIREHEFYVELDSDTRTDFESNHIVRGRFFIRFLVIIDSEKSRNQLQRIEALMLKLVKD